MERETQEKAASGRSAFVNESWNEVSSGRIWLTDQAVSWRPRPTYTM
ncbi:hypothetical protein [Streptomyces kasugaensis]|nr:hypothetical protein [Streptomyces kasugaensis]